MFAMYKLLSKRKMRFFVLSPINTLSTTKLKSFTNSLQRYCILYFYVHVKTFSHQSLAVKIANSLPILQEIIL